MGSLTLPDGGLVYLDANSLIYTVERVERYRSLLDPMWQAAQGGDLTVASGGLIVVESLAKPLRDSNREIEAQYRELFEASVFRVLDMPLAVFERAAEIRTFAHLTTADALHGATALHVNRDLFANNDAAFRRSASLVALPIHASQTSLSCRLNTSHDLIRSFFSSLLERSPESDTAYRKAQHIPLLIGGPTSINCRA